MFLRSLVFSLLLLVVGCSAESPASAEKDAELNRRIEVQLRSRFARIPADAKLEIGARKPSDTAGFDTIPVTIVRGEVRSTLEFLIARDNSMLIVEKLDLAELPGSKIDLTGRPVRGNPNAKVTVVNFDDFQCPYCQLMHEQLTNSVLKAYGDKIKLVYKDYPLVSIHPWATHAHVNANCLAEQNAGAYWAYADHVHDKLKEINSNQKGEKRPLVEQKQRLDQAVLDIGKKHALDSARLHACIKKQDDSMVKRSMSEGDSLGVDSTPTLFVNGERVAGAVPPEDFRHVLDRALRAAGEQPPPAATTGANTSASEKKD